jgi:hypothetical protein
MKRLALAILIAAACSGKSKPPTTGTGSGAGSGSAIYAKRLVVSWGISPNGVGDAAEVFMQTTDETGKQVSHALGTFAGTCKVIKPAEDMKAVTGVNCTQGDKGVELHATVVVDEIVVLKLPVQLGVAPDPMGREEVLRFKAPAGSAVEAAP